MPQIQIFACPSCGASMSIEEGDVQIKCMFCSNTVIVPEELRVKSIPHSHTLFPEDTDQSDPPIKPVYPSVSRPPTQARGVVTLMAVFVGLGCTLALAILGTAIALFQVESPSDEIATEVSNIEIPTFEFPTELPEATATPALAEVVLSFGGEGTDAGKFQDPRSIAIDGEGNIYVAEYQTGRVQKFSPEGEFLDSWITKGDTPLRGMAADQDGNVYAVRGGAILKYEGTTGNLLQTIKGNDYFDDVAVLPEGGLLACACFGKDDLVFLNPKGEVVKRVKQAVTSQTDETTTNVRVAVDGLGNIFLLSAFDSAVFKFTPEGKFVDQFSGEGDDAGQLRAPYALAVDNQSRIYVSDFKGIQVFDADGRYLDLIQPPDYAFVYGLTFNAENELFVVGSNQVYKFVLKEE
jgi:sugar lactone lactonase YvrE